MIPHGANFTFSGDNIRFFRDYPREIAEKRILFKKTRNILKGNPKVRYGVIYSAKMKITYSIERSFTDSELAFKCAQDIVKKIEENAEY